MAKYIIEIDDAGYVAQGQGSLSGMFASLDDLTPHQGPEQQPINAKDNILLLLGAGLTAQDIINLKNEGLL